MVQVNHGYGFSKTCQTYYLGRIVLYSGSTELSRLLSCRHTIDLLENLSWMHHRRRESSLFHRYLGRRIRHVGLFSMEDLGVLGLIDRRIREWNLFDVFHPRSMDVPELWRHSDWKLDNWETRNIPFTWIWRDHSRY